MKCIVSHTRIVKLLTFKYYYLFIMNEFLLFMSFLSSLRMPEWYDDVLTYALLMRTLLKLSWFSTYSLDVNKKKLWEQ